MLSDKEIAAIDAKAQTFAQFARAIIAAYQSKLLAGVEMPEPFSMEDDQLTYTYDQLQQYAAAAAAQAREKALSEAKRAVDYAGGDNADYHMDAIDRLKGDE